MIRTRVWNDLSNSIFYSEYLGLYINHIKRKNKWIESVLISCSIIGIAGWNRFSSQHIIWTILLTSVVIFRLLKNKIIIPTEKISTFDKLRYFYFDHFKRLEDLWYKIEGDKISEVQAEKIFKKLNDEEQLMIKIEKHDKLLGEEPFKSKAEISAITKLKKYEI